MGMNQVVLECELVTSKQLLGRRKHKMFQDFLIDSSSDVCLHKKNTEIQLQLLTFLPMMFPHHGALWKFNAGFRAARLVSFAGLPPNSWSSVSKRNENFDSSEKIT